MYGTDYAAQPDSELKSQPFFWSGWLSLFDVGVVVNVFLAVAVVAIATGAVAEFQIRMGNISLAAYGAAVSIEGLLFLFCGAEEDGAALNRPLGGTLALCPPA